MTVPVEKQVSLLSTPFEPLLHRHSANPILTSKDWPYPINSVFNAGATMLADGTTLLLCRVEDRRGLSHLCAARSRNGVDGWQIDNEPTLMPDPKNHPDRIAFRVPTLGANAGVRDVHLVKSIHGEIRHEIGIGRRHRFAEPHGRRLRHVQDDQPRAVVAGQGAGQLERIT